MTVLGRSAGRTDTGKKRRRNEDAYVKNPPLFAVADGMGGAAAGELASKLAAAALNETPAEKGADAEERVVRLIQEANRRVYERSHEDAGASGMGTTTTVALVDDERVWFGHVGDSRAYLIRDGKIEQLTQDHSLVAELMRSGKLSPEEAETHPQRSVITRALGTDPDVDVDTFQIPAQAGDVFLICSDGLTTMVDDDVIRDLVDRHRGDLDAATKALVNAANRGGGEDNITVVAFEIAAADEALEQTVEYKAADLAETAEPDDEDTLTEEDRVPAVDTMVVSPEDAAKFSAPPKAEQKRRRGPAIAALVLLLGVLVALAIVLWVLTR